MTGEGLHIQMGTWASVTSSALQNLGGKAERTPCSVCGLTAILIVSYRPSPLWSWCYALVYISISDPSFSASQEAGEAVPLLGRGTSRRD